MVRSIVLGLLALLAASPALAQITPTAQERQEAAQYGGSPLLAGKPAPVAFYEVREDNRVLLSCLAIVPTGVPASGGDESQLLEYRNRCSFPLHLEITLGVHLGTKCRPGETVHATIVRTKPQIGADPGELRCIASVTELSANKHLAGSSFPGDWRRVPGIVAFNGTRLIWFVNLSATKKTGDIATAQILQIDEDSQGGVRTNAIDLRFECAAQTALATGMQNYDRWHRPIYTAPEEVGVLPETYGLAGLVMQHACSGGGQDWKGGQDVQQQATWVFLGNPR